MKLLIPIIFGIGFLLGVWVFTHCAEPQSAVPLYADVKFISIENLDARTDSILSICHTDSSYRLVNGLGEPWWNYHQVCRYFISREIWWMPEESRPGIWMQMPTSGKARIFYGEKIKEE